MKPDFKLIHWSKFRGICCYFFFYTQERLIVTPPNERGSSFIILFLYKIIFDHKFKYLFLIRTWCDYCLEINNVNLISKVSCIYANNDIDEKIVLEWKMMNYYCWIVACVECVSRLGMRLEFRVSWYVIRPPFHNITLARTQTFSGIWYQLLFCLMYDSDCLSYKHNELDKNKNYVKIINEINEIKKSWPCVCQSRKILTE